MRLILFLLSILVHSQIGAQKYMDTIIEVGAIQYKVFAIKIDSSLVGKFRIIENKSLLSEKHLFDSLQSDGDFFAVNAGIIDPKCHLLGLYINDSVQISPINLNTGTGNFYLLPNGFVGISAKEIVINESQKYAEPNTYRFAVQSGPMLISGGKVNQQFNPASANKNFRVAVGIGEINKEKQLIFISSVDPTNFFDLATVFQKNFQCKEALNLESGPITTMHRPAEKSGYRPDVHLCNLIYIKLQ